MASRKLKHYFQAHRIKVLSSQPLGALFCNSEAVGRIRKWAIELNEFVVDFEHISAIKSQALLISSWVGPRQLLTPQYNLKNQHGPFIVSDLRGWPA